MSTLGSIAAEVANDYFKREDLQEIALKFATRAYLLITKRVPFEELQQKTIEVPISTSAVEHDLTTFDPPVAGIIHIRIKDPAGAVRKAKRSNTTVLDMVQAATGAQPSQYARFARRIEFDRVAPATGWTFMMRYWAAVSIEPSAGDTQLCWEDQQEWDELLFWETIYRVHLHLGQAEAAAALIQPMPMPRGPETTRRWVFEPGILMRLWNDLLITISDREAIDEDFGINPQVRRYVETR